LRLEFKQRLQLDDPVDTQYDGTAAPTVWYVMEVQLLYSFYAFVFLVYVVFSRLA
jgi:hypothetical protein